MSVSKSLNIRASLVLSMSRRLSTNRAKASLKLFKEVNPNDCKLMLQTKTRRFKDKKEVQVNLFEHVQDYANHFMEKRLIFDPKVAQEIVTLIRDHSEGQKCPFIDADAGLCLIAREWQNICPNRPVIVFQRDQALTPLADKLLNKNDHLPQISVKNHNLLMYEEAQGSSSGKNFSNKNSENSYSSLTYEYRNSWENPAPGYSLFATATHGFCKAITSHCLDSWSKAMEVDNFFYHVRPEFFLMVNAKTYAHLSHDVGTGNYRLRKPYNYLFKILFDCELISEFDDTIYMPSKAAKKTRDYDMTKFYLIKVRPKVESGIQDRRNFQPHLLFHFAEMLCTGKYRTKFIEAIEKLTPGAGFDFIKYTGLSVNTQMGDIKVEQIMPLFNILTSQKNFSASGFVTSAQLHKEDKERSVWSSED